MAPTNMLLAWTGFSSARQYWASLRATGMLLRKRAFLTSTEQGLHEALHESKADMKHVLGVVDLVCFGIAMMLGAGVFVTTGYVAASISGPAVVLSYAVAGLSALLSSLCYAEFAVDMPYAGGAYTYISATLGQYLAWVTVANLILEYILANAAVVRGYVPYFALLVGRSNPQELLVSWRGYQLDWWAFGLCCALTLLLVLGTRESATFNTATTALHLALVALIIVAGLAMANSSNAMPFAPHGATGVFSGASVVFFGWGHVRSIPWLVNSYIGFDTVATAAEECKDPARDLPLGILGAVGIVTLLYILMAAALVLMVPSSGMPPEGASFAAAFQAVGLGWVQYVVAAGACLGIITSVLVGMYGASRIITGVARDHLLPPGLATVHARLRTPWVALLLQGALTAGVSLFTEFKELSEMVSLSTLFAFLMVALALLWRRSYGAPGTSPPLRGRPLLLLAGHLGALLAAAVALAAVWRSPQKSPWGLGVCCVALVGIMGSFAGCIQQQYVPGGYKVPWYPWLPCLSVVLNMFLMGQVAALAYVRFVLWTGMCTAGYVLYGVHASAAKGSSGKLGTPRGGDGPAAWGGLYHPVGVQDGSSRQEAPADDDPLLRHHQQQEQQQQQQRDEQELAVWPSNSSKDAGGAVSTYTGSRPTPGGAARQAQPVPASNGSISSRSGSPWKDGHGDSPGGATSRGVVLRSTGSAVRLADSSRVS